MILVADRCGLSTGSLEAMKVSVLRAMKEYVDIEDLDDVDINVTADEDSGTIYSVNVPVKRVKPSVRASIAAMDNAEEVAEGITFKWGEGDLGSEGERSSPAPFPEDRFPYGA